MDLAKEYILSQYQELGALNGNECVKIVRNSITGRIAVKKWMSIEQKFIYTFLKLHRNEFIPEIYECFENDRQLIVIEEYIEGRNLEDILCEWSMSIEESCRIVKELCRALYPLHMAEPSIVCRDLKPENIMLTLCGKVKLIDFDIARVVSPGKNRDTVVMGTEGFAAPEQFGHRQTDGRSDIYALGTILNYLLSGKFPVEEIADGKLGDVVRRCIAVNPDERYQNVKELEMDLERLYPSNVRYVQAPENVRRSERGVQEQVRRKERASWTRFLPPGFRSGTVWKMLIAIIGYLMLIVICLGMEVKEGEKIITGPEAFTQQILFLLSQLAEIGFIFNYLGWRDRVPLLNSANYFLRIAAYLVLEFVFISIAVLFWEALAVLFW